LVVGIGARLGGGVLEGDEEGGVREGVLIELVGVGAVRLLHEGAAMMTKVGR